MCEEIERAGEGIMNASMPQKSLGRPAGLNPFDIRVSIEASETPPRVSERDARKERAEAEIEYGCVDWFQYHVETDQGKTTH
jgi:hypothetical protein